MRITVDTNVLVSSLGWNGPEAKVIGLVLDGKLELCLSAQIISEFYRVSKYPKFGFLDSEVDGFIGRLLTRVTMVEPVSFLEVIKEDPADNRVLECALAGNVDYIISGDNHLLKLAQYNSIEILRSPVFLKKANL